DPCVPYGWQFGDEKVFMPASKGAGINCLALLSRSNHCHFSTARQTITSSFILEQFEQLSWRLSKPTVIVLDNARIHTSKVIKERISVWQKRGLFLFYLPRYSPHLNIVETLWRKLKYEWLLPTDYETTDKLFYTVRQALAAVGTDLKIKFSRFGLLQANSG
ncbi:MAG TPA: transposase, partial [Pyrinomonadaceae bacterium]|nr:transposase [Pyrinomonadaceae bacterium]